MRTFENGAHASVSISMRSCGEKSRFLEALTPTATTTSSKRAEAREMMSMCPLVTGSNDPGHAARRTMTARALLDSARCGCVTVPKRGLAVAPRSVPGEPGGPHRSGGAAGAFDDDQRLVPQPAMGDEGAQVRL